MYKIVLYSTFCCLFAVGCGPKSTLKTVPVTGVVMYEGKPLEGAQVGFVVTDNFDAAPANGTTDAAGKFSLNTYLGGSKHVAGAAPGNYTVTVTKYENPAGPMPTSPEAASQAPPQQSSAEQREKLMEQMRTRQGQPTGPVLVTPQKYASPQSSDLKITIKDSGNEAITLELK